MCTDSMRFIPEINLVEKGERMETATYVDGKMPWLRHLRSQEGRDSCQCEVDSV